MVRPTRWTKHRRVTKPGKGGWSIHIGPPLWLMYVHPLSGDAVSAAPWHLAWMLRHRRAQERKRAD